MKGAVWAGLGILGLNVLLVGVLLIALAVQRFRSARAQRRLEARWRIPKLPSATAGRLRGRRFAYAGLAVVALWAFAGLAGIRPTHAVTSAVATMVHGTDTSDGFEGRAISAAGDRSGHPRDGGATPVAGTRGGIAPAAPSSSTESSGGSGPRGGDLGAPSTVAAVPTSPTSILLAWTGVADATGYQIFRSTGSELWRGVATTDPGVTAYTDDGLAAATTYFYRVVAITDTGTAPPSDVVSATTAPAPLPATTLTCASTTPDAIDLSWAEVGGETGYRIERSTDGVSDWTTIATTGQGVTVYTDAGLSPGTTYSFRVFAEDAAGESPASNVCSATTAVEQTPPPSQTDATETAAT